jgi:hypothetical protein
LANFRQGTEIATHKRREVLEVLIDPILSILLAVGGDLNPVAVRL